MAAFNNCDSCVFKLGISHLSELLIVDDFGVSNAYLVMPWSLSVSRNAVLGRKLLAERLGDKCLKQLIKYVREATTMIDWEFQKKTLEVEKKTLKIIIRRSSTRIK